MPTDRMKQAVVISAVMLVCLHLLRICGVAAQPLADPFIVVLGISQDGGTPQAGTRDHPGWDDEAYRRLVTSLALVDPATSGRWLFEATPDFRLQLHMLDTQYPVEAVPGISGIFLTHAHIGHYSGLMFLGHESMGAAKIPVFAMPRMRAFLASNGPWDQLIRYGNVELKHLEEHTAVVLNDRLSVTPLLVPHRQEYSEVVGFRIDGPNRSVLFLPDVDSWEDWDEQGTRIEDVLETVDVAYIDATFFSDGEIPGRDMSGFPHPFITHTMKRLEVLSATARAKVRFIHLNHTNPAQRGQSNAREEIERKGFRVAEEGEVVLL